MTPPSERFGSVDLHLFNEGRHEQLYELLGAHVVKKDGASGIEFAVWAPNAEAVRLIGDFNGWDGSKHSLSSVASSGIWKLFVPGLKAGAKYKFEIKSRDGRWMQKADPFAFGTELPPATASVAYKPAYQFKDEKWIEQRKSGDPFHRPISIYEMHLGSWRRVPEDGDRPMTYREMAPALADYLVDMGFTHVEFMPVMEHPYSPSWGYQVTSYFAPTSRFGTPDDFRFLVDYLHSKGIGVILDWVPAHFPKDDWALGRFDGSALYEHLDPRQGEHPDWGTYIFNYSRTEVRNFLLANALFWLLEYHADGLRLDAVASMLYLDYSRPEGQWIPNAFGGREDLDAIAFLKELNAVAHAKVPGVMMVAEESTAWPGVSRPTFSGGLGFGFKWNMGWMHDTLSYFSKDPVYRRHHHHQLTFGFLYAWNENFVLPLSHDEVVHGKGSLLTKMPGDRWQRFANLRALYGYMWAHPGKKLLFMGGELGQWKEWDANHSLDWHLLSEPEHAGIQRLVRDLNRVYKSEAPMWECDIESSGFHWIDADNANENVLAFIRNSRDGRQVIIAANLSPVVRGWYRLGLPGPGEYKEIINTDSGIYGGSNKGNLGVVRAEPRPWNGQPYSAEIVLPPLSVVWFKAPD